MSELQGPRIPGEERSRRRRPIGWIIAGLVALLLLALLIPFACQALTGGSDPQGGASASQEDTSAQDSSAADGGDASGDENRGAASGESADGDGGGEVAAAGENTGAQTADDGGSRGEGGASETDGAPSDGAGSGEGRPGEPLPETGGTSPAVLFALVISLVGVAGGLSVLARRHGPSRG
jgi:hypothetical protein